MNSRSVILLGLLASLLLIFLCVFFNAERYYKELGLGANNKEMVASELSESDNREVEQILPDSNDTIVETKEEDKVEVISASEEKIEETSSFNYYVENNKTFISGEIPLLDNGDTFKEIIANCSKDKLCENNVTFLDNGETLSWKDFVSSTLSIFKQQKVSNPKLSINKKDIKLEGEFFDKTGKDQLSTLIQNYKNVYNISDLTTVKEALKESPNKVDPIILSTTEENSTQKEMEKTPTTSLASEQEEISSLLKNNKITFKRNSGKIREEGKKVLDKVVELLKGKENILIEVEGHTDAGGKEKINLWISQARADGVKKYLIQKGIKADSITAKGFGEKKLLLAQKPYDPSNRRVEIHLKRK